MIDYMRGDSSRFGNVDNDRRHNDYVKINQSINLFAIKGHRPLTNHTNSTNITTERKKVIQVIRSIWIGI